MGATSLDLILAVLADPTRRRIIDSLRKRPGRAGELATALGVTAAAMSRHLRLLRESGLVALDPAVHAGRLAPQNKPNKLGSREPSDRRDKADKLGDARVRIYQLRPAPLIALRAWLEKAVSVPTLKKSRVRPRAALA